MCGVAGYFCTASAPAPSREVLARMGEALAHRGPDDAGVWQGRHAGLAHRRLSVLDTSAAGHQPMQSRDGRYAVSYNGEIYNFRELRAELEALGHSFATACDTEVLLEAWAAWGEETPARLNGIFAFAIIDTEQERLWLVRDRLGVKPMFYTESDGALVFASELQALRAGAFTGNTLNRAALDAYLNFLYIPAPDTIYAGVQKLCPAEMLIADRRGLRRKRYWEVTYAIDDTWTIETAATRLDGLLRESLAAQQISDVPLGAFLSGGIDSSAVVAYATEARATPLKTFCIGFDDGEADERKYARAVARHLGTDHHEEVLSPEWFSLLPRIVRHFGEPFADSSALPMGLVSEIARREVTVALSGDGGDELFAGYTWAHMNQKVAAYRRVPAALRHLADAALRAAPASPRLARIRRFSQDSFRAPDASFRRRLTCFSADQRAELYLPEVAQELGDAAVDRFDEHLDALAALRPEDRMLALDTRMYLPDDILTKVDRMSMAQGLEARVPLLDHRIVEFAATVPFHLKYAQGVSKRIVKRALAQRLPGYLLGQRKRGFSLPIDRWFRGPLRPHFLETVCAPEARCNAYLDPLATGRLLSDHAAGRENHGHRLWALLVFEHWLRECAPAPLV